MKSRRTVNKVLFFVQDGVGGAERMSALIGRNLDREKNDVCFCLVKRPSKSSITDFLPADIRKIWISNRNSIDLLVNIAKILIKENPSIVFSSVFNLSNKILLLKWLVPKAKFIIRCDNYMYTYSDKQQKVLKRVYPKADIIIAQTEEMGQELTDQAGIPLEKVRVLHNPVDKALIDSKIEGAKNPYLINGKKHFVAVGRFNPQKGFDLLIEAFIKVASVRNDVDLHIVGDTSVGAGSVAEAVRKRAEVEGVSDLVTFYGYQDNPFPYIRFADCFVLSSRWEGLPNVLIEALYLGTPAAAFKSIPIIERIVNEGEDGVLAEKENVSSLAKAMMEAVDMGRVKSSYKSAQISDFTELFN